MENELVKEILFLCMFFVCLFLVVVVYCFLRISMWGCSGVGDSALDFKSNEDSRPGLYLCQVYVKWVIYLTIILRNRAEYHLILSRRGRRPSWLNQGIFRKIEQDNCFIIQQIPIDYHFQNEKNYGSMIKTLKASNTSA